MIDIGWAVAAAGLAGAAGWWFGHRRAGRRLAADVLAERAERHQAELDAARRRMDVELQLAGVDEAVDGAVLILDAALDVMHANARAREWFAIRAAERPSLMAAIRSAELRAVVDDARRGNTETQPVRIAHRLFAARAVPLRNGQIVLALADRTQLEYLERARRDLVANVSHDLRTPLTTLGLLLDALHARLDDPSDGASASPIPAPTAPDGAALLNEMDEQVGRIRDMADDLVQLNQLESGRALFRLVGERVDEMVESACASVARLMAEGGLQVVVNVPPDLRVLADRGHIVRVVVNLLDNARRFSPAGGVITVTGQPLGEPPGADEAASDVLVCVNDHGPGIPPRDRQRIFERFYRGDRARRGGGTGLGLAIAKHIVEGHGGRIWAGDGPDGGAAVCFTLLAAPAEAPRVEPEDGAAGGG